MPRWFQFDPDRRPDSDFEPGELAHLVVGNEGRLLDFRRTPIRIVALSDETGLATIEILAFEDKGAYWDLLYEGVGRYQFLKGSPRCSDDAVSRIEASIRNNDRSIDIPCDAAERQQTREALRRARREARNWIDAHSLFAKSQRPLPEGAPEGSDLLYADTRRFMSDQGLGDVEEFVTRQYVSHMNNESVKAHRIAAAKLGLAPYKGKALRDPEQLVGPLSLERRQRHLVVRMGFTQAVFQAAGREHVILYRMESSERPLDGRRQGTVLVSASFRMDIVQEMSGWADPMRTVVLYRQAVPIERVFMTYLETGAMNRPFREAEAVLIADPANYAF